ncbi:putative Colicin V production family protein [uncultured delta proteobacterium]|uniref:Putative Colicin V production family protein n=1 Tax=uncultured delta proteobacterium TaxID=34034 RepID=A0A212J9R7_9DELT|nr:putative Colicin V production family protein [uncultured delta proteobacterium]
MLEINLLDIAAGVILLFFLIRGLMRGLAREVGSIVGIIGGFALARHFQPKLQPTMESLFSSGSVAGVVSFVLIFVVTLIVVSMLVFALRKFMSITLTLWIDHFLGALGGLAKGLLLLTLIFYLIRGFFPDLTLVQNAQAAPFFESLADYLRAFLPDAFTSYKLPTRL